MYWTGRSYRVGGLALSVSEYSVEVLLSVYTRACVSHRACSDVVLILLETRVVLPIALVDSSTSITMSSYYLASSTSITTSTVYVSI